MARRISVLVAAIAVVLSLGASPAFSAGVEGKVIKDRFTVPSGSSRTIEIECPAGFEAVAGYVLKRGGATFVFASERRGDGWSFSVSRLGDFPADEIRIEVICVRFSEKEARFRAELRLEVRDRTTRFLEPGDSTAIRVPCPGGFAPAGWGYLETADGSGTEPPSPFAGSRIATAKPVPGAMRFLVESTGGEGFFSELQAICIDRRYRDANQLVETQTLRETTQFEVPAGGDETVRARCAGGGAAAGAGWALPEQTSLFPFPLGWRGDNRFRTNFASASSEPESGNAYQLSLNAEVM